MGLVTYSIDKMRVTAPGAKTALRNPERLWTVSGTFYSTEVDAKSHRIVRKDKLSFASKNIDREDALAVGFRVDQVNGILTLPEGERGRKAAEGLTQESIEATLAALRNPTPEPVPAES